MVQYPWRRAELIEFIRELANPEYQERVWVNLELLPDTGFPQDSFNLVFNEMEMMALFDEPQAAVGYILAGESEIVALKPLLDALAGLIEKYGGLLADQEYFDKLEWATVVATAKQAQPYFVKDTE